MPPPDPTHAYLKSRGSPAHVVAGGLAGLLDRWQQVVDKVSSGYDLTFDDYLNDMDLRQLIQDTLPHASSRGLKQATTRLYQLDESLRPHLRPTRACIWGPKPEMEYRWTPQRSWWYFAVPKHPKPPLTDELAKIH
ncbi:MAG TPA: hypothetical protein VH475_29410 [Tepidisphaeraceae bacterium]|jgi:hypothetical protein